MRPTAFDFLRTYTENDTLFNALSGLTDKDLVFWLFDYGSRLARWRLCYELGKTTHTELARRTEFWVGRLNSGVVPGELFPCHTASTGGAL